MCRYVNLLCTLWQDALLLNAFYNLEIPTQNYYPITYSQQLHIQQLIGQIEYELVNQIDGFWPCRSRSYYIELLFAVNRIMQEETYQQHEDMLVKTGKTMVADMISYMTNNMHNRIRLEDVSKHFSINRNQVNAYFFEETGKTMLQYLIQLRMQLAVSLLTNTELPIYEIAARVGYEDESSFSRAFKQYMKETPARFRKNQSCKDQMYKVE